MRHQNTSGEERALDVTQAITVNRPPEDLPRFWYDLENLPRFMEHREAVPRQPLGTAA